MELSQRLLVSLEATGMNQTALAKLAGVTSQSINRLLSGASQEFSCPSVFRIARALNVDPEWLATGLGDPQRKAGAADQPDPILAVLASMPPADEAYWRSRIATELLNINRNQKPQPRERKPSPKPPPKAKGAA